MTNHQMTLQATRTVRASPRNTRVLITGGSGKIGRHLVADLCARGYQVRCLTSATPTPSAPGVEWRHHDWREHLNFDPLVDGCDAVLHLGGEVWRTPQMMRLNVEATEALAAAAERRNVRFMAYTSSVAVYGSARTANVTENSPVVTSREDVRGENLGNYSYRTYARTKLLAEQKIAAGTDTVEYVIVRPTVVVDIPHLIKLRDMSSLKRILLGRRYTHYIYVKDVADALIWFLERALGRSTPQAGIETYNLSNDDAKLATLADFYAKAQACTGDKRFKSSLHAPLWIYDLADMAKNRMISSRYSLGRMYYSPEKLYAAGYSFKYGMDKAYERALAAEYAS